MDTSVRGQVIEVAVMVDGQRLSIHRRKTDGQAFVAAVPGMPYKLVARNLDVQSRVEILCAVDGRNTLEDGVADLQQNGGMVVGVSGVATFSGWRLGDKETAQFVFTDPEGSIAQAATGDIRNTGIIGFAAYVEAYHQPVLRRGPTRGGGDVFSEGLESARSKGGLDASDLGTGIGQVQYDPVGRTHFQRAARAPEVLSIRYATSAWLERNGIVGPPEPQAFPGLPTGYGKYLPRKQY